MKTNNWTLVIALICMLAFTACNEKKTGTNETAEESETVIETDEGSDEDSATAEIDGEEAISESDDEGSDDEWENEVWTSFGGTYFFFGDGEQYVVDFPLGEEHDWATLSIRGEQFKADVNPKTGLITACDDAGKEVFRGAIYAGGNLLKGTYRGEQIKAWGSGD